MCKTGERVWSIEKYREAAKQLGITDDHVIFMMSETVAHIDGASEAIDKLGTNDLLWPGEVKEALATCIHKIKLPDCWALVGVAPIGKNSPLIYRLVNLSESGSP